MAFSLPVLHCSLQRLAFNDKEDFIWQGQERERSIYTPMLKPLVNITGHTEEEKQYFFLKVSNLYLAEVIAFGNILECLQAHAHSLTLPITHAGNSHCCHPH